MEKKTGTSHQRLEAFFAGQGFYIVLLLCAAVIGISAWCLFSHNRTDVEALPAASIATAHPSTPPSATPETEETLEIPETPDLTEPVDETIPETVPSAAETPLFVWPVNGEVITPHAMDTLLYNKTMKDWRTHNGLDIAADVGTTVMAIAGGTVTDLYQDDCYGTTVVIEHRDGISSSYSNLAEVPAVSIGDTLAVGDIIGSVGKTALWEAGEQPHLHLSVTTNGECADPVALLPAR